MIKKEEKALTAKQIKMLGWLPKLGALYQTTDTIKVHKSVKDAKKWASVHSNNPNYESIATFSYDFPSERTMFITRVTPPSRSGYPAIIEFMPNEHEIGEDFPDEENGKIWLLVFLIYPPVNTSGYPIWQYFLKLMEAE